MDFRYVVHGLDNPFRKSVCTFINLNLKKKYIYDISKAVKVKFVLNYQSSFLFEFIYDILLIFIFKELSIYRPMALFTCISY